MSDHMFNEDGICDCTECWPTNTQRPNREKTMNLEKGKTYRRDELSQDDWCDAVSATEGAKVAAWWKHDYIGVEPGIRGRVSRDKAGDMRVPATASHSTYLLLKDAPSPYLTEFTVLELPARLDPAKALVVRDTYGDLWAMVASSDRWQALNGEDWATHSTAALHHPLTVVIDADGNVVEEGDR